MADWRKKESGKKSKNNRVKLIMAIVFLFGLGLIARLFYLQIYHYEMYADLAAGQHLSSRTLEPSRGRIFVQQDNANEEDKYFPLATNKDFAIVHAIPKDIEDPADFARKIYFVYDREGIAKKAEEKVAARQAELAKATTTAEIEFLKMQIELAKDQAKADIRKARDEKISEYADKFSQKSSVYRRIALKVDEDRLLKTYAYLEADPEKFQPDEAGDDKKVEINLDIYKYKNGLVYKTGENGEEKEVEIKGIAYTLKTYRYYPENNISSHLLGFVSYQDDDRQIGNYGLEEYFNNELTGVPGMVKAERGAGGSLIIVNDREYNKPKNGSDLILTIDYPIQYFACKKLNEAVLKHGADGGSVIVMAPDTGEIMAICGSPDFDPNNYSEVKDISYFNNPAVFNQYEPGSIFKVITMAIGLDLNKVTPETTYEDTGVVRIAGYDIKNSDLKAHGVVDMNVVLEESLNTGVIFVVRQTGLDAFKKYLFDFGFGEGSGIELPGEARGNINNLDDKLHRELYTYTASFGQGISVTPLQMAAAFSAIANGGTLLKPYVVKEVVNEDGSKIGAERQEIRRVISEKASSLLGAMLVNVVENGHGKKAGVKGYYIAGKTGTAQIPRKDGRGYDPYGHIGSFAGFGPVEDPEFAMIVRIDNPRDVEWAESSAAPLFGEIAKFILEYKKIEPTRKIEEVKK